MAYAYVYAPISGIVTGRDYYCNCPACYGNCSGCLNAHGRCKNWSSPIDIAGTGSTCPTPGSICLYVNYPTVRRVRTWVEYLCCCKEPNNSYARSITVDLYIYDNGKYCYVGSVMYGHVANPTVSNGQWIDLTSRSYKLGDIVGGCYLCKSCPNPSDQCNCPTCSCSNRDCRCTVCYSGSHVHLERYLGETVAPCCCVDVAQGTTAIYRFYYNPGYTC